MDMGLLGHGGSAMGVMSYLFLFVPNLVHWFAIPDLDCICNWKSNRGLSLLRSVRGAGLTPFYSYLVMYSKGLFPIRV